MDFVWTLLDFSMELTKVCVGAWNPCYCVEATLLCGWAQNYSSLARSCVEPTLLRGWAQNCSPRIRNCVGFHAIA